MASCPAFPSRTQRLPHLQPWTAGLPGDPRWASPSLPSLQCQPSCPALEVGLPKPALQPGHHAVPGHRLAGHQHHRLPGHVYECDREALNLRWHCRTLGDQLSLLLGGRSSNTSKAGTPERGDQTRSGQWRIYGSDEDLCARPYYGERLLAGQGWGPRVRGLEPQGQMLG